MFVEVNAASTMAQSIKQLRTSLTHTQAEDMPFVLSLAFKRESLGYSQGGKVSIKAFIVRMRAANQKFTAVIQPRLSLGSLGSL